MNSEQKPDNSDDILSFFSPRLKEILRRLAHYDRRSEHQELIWLVEARAYGKLLYREGENVNPILSLEGLPSPLVERATVQKKAEKVPERG